MATRDTHDDIDLGATVEVDSRTRVRISLTALGAIAGALIAVVATGIIAEGLIVILGGFVGWGAGLLTAVWLDRHRTQERLEATSRDELYETAQHLGIDGRSQMTKDELAKAVRDAQG